MKLIKWSEELMPAIREQLGPEVTLDYQSTVAERIEELLLDKFALSPADYEALNLAGWAVWQKLISWLSCKIKFHWAQSEKKTIAPATSIEIIQVLRFMADLEQKHSAALDKYREMLADVEAWRIIAPWIDTRNLPKLIQYQLSQNRRKWRQARSDERPSGRAEVERGQEGEEK